MAVIIDRTLTKIEADTMVPSDLLHFCELLFTCGVAKIEATPQVLKRISNFLLNPDLLIATNSKTYFLTNYDGFFQLETNDLVEKQLAFSTTETYNLNRVRLLGFDDLITRDYRTFFNKLLSSGSQYLDLCPSNKKHCATAIAIEWLLMGGQSVSCSFAGLNDDAPLEEVLMALKMNGKTNLIGDLSVFKELRLLYEQLTGNIIPEKKAIIGQGIFKVESGIHVDGILKNPRIYEPFSPESVGNKREIILGKHSGQQSVIYKMRELNLSESCVSTVLLHLKEHCANVGKSFSDLELRTLVREVHNGY